MLDYVESVTTSRAEKLINLFSCAEIYSLIISFVRMQEVGGGFPLTNYFLERSPEGLARYLIFESSILKIFINVENLLLYL